MRIRCPVCGCFLCYSEKVTEYGFLREEDGLVTLEWNGTAHGSGYSILCDQPGCTFKIKDYLDLRDRIDSNLG